MSQAKDGSPQPPLEALNKEDVKGFHISDGTGVNYVVHNHVNAISCNLVTPSFCTSPHKHPDSHVVDIDIEEATTVEYSENPNSSVVSSCLKNGPGCSGGYYDDSEEDRPGSFDYMPSQSGHVRISNTINPTFDEEVKLDSSIGSSVVNLPQDSQSFGDNDPSTAAEKQDTSTPKEAACLPHTKHKHPCWDYMPCGKHSEDEDMEDEEDERARENENDERSHNSGGLVNTSFSFTSSFPKTVKQVDECVSYSLKPLNGHGTGYTTQELTPIPYNSYHEQSALEGSKEDKKISRSKDDSDKPDVSGQVDINGNPHLLDSANYLQMRQWPKGKSSPSSSPTAQPTYTSITIPPSVNSSGSDPNTFDRKKERRRMKLERLKGTPAEAYKGYRKFSDIDEILYFVEGSNTAYKSENKPAKKKDKERIRKKDNHINGPLALEDSAEVEDASQTEESAVVTVGAKPTERAMGNSFRKAVGEDSITKTWSEDDADKNDFHDCLNTLPAEFVTSEISISSVDKQPIDTSGNNYNKAVVTTTSTLIHQSDSLSALDSRTEKQLTDNKTVTKKPTTKTKNKREKQDATDVFEPVSQKFNMVKPEEILTAKDTILVTSVLHTGSGLFNNSTDKEPVPDVRREESFTEVKKRKKRPGGKEVTAAIRNKFGSSSYHPHINNIHTHYNSHRPRTSTPPPLPVASSVTASVTSSTSWPSSNPAQSPRDLSPSAFPVLSSQGVQSAFHTEARRNSCGDLNTECIDSKIYDSDRESAKSLPAAHGARIGGELSPIFPVSYARMAAVLPKNDSINSQNSESGVASISRNSSVNSSIIHTVNTNIENGLSPSHSNATATPERKTTVWKGSPRERRHSIGSSPEDIVENEKSSVSERNRQCGSQEVLSRSIVACKDVAATSSPVRPNPTVASSMISQPSTDITKTIISALAKCTSNQLKDSVTPASHVTKFQNAEQKTISQPTEYATIISTSSQTSPANAAFNPSTVPQPSELSLTTASSGMQENIGGVHSCKITKTATQTVRQSGSLPPTANESSKAAFTRNRLLTGPDSTRKNSSLKSVIFLDKRFDSLSPANLGITFGFDSSYESKCEPTSQPPNQQVLPSQPPASSELSSSSSSSRASSRDTLTQTAMRCPAISQDSPHIPSTAQIAAALPKLRSSSSNNPPGDDGGHCQVPKGVHTCGPCNGLILPSNPSGSYSSPQVTSCGASSDSVSSSSDTPPQDLATSQRTSHSGLKPGDAVSLNINSNKNSDALLFFGSASLSRNDPLVPITLPNPASTTLTDNPLSQRSVPKTTDTLLGKPSEPALQKTCTGVTFTASSSIQSPPCSHTIEGRDNTDCTNSASLPSALDFKEKPQTCKGCPKLAESVLRESTASPSGNLEDTKDILEASSPAIIAVAPSPTASQQAPPDNQSKPVVYGLKMKPGGGCGSLLFVPSNTSKKSRRNSTEIGNFLTKRWSEVVMPKMDSGAFVTLDEV